MANTADLSLDRQGSLVLPFALSVLFHALFVLLFAIRALNAPAPASSPFEVQLLQPQESPSAKAKAQADAQAKAAEKAPAAPAEQVVPPPKNQIVSPPDSPEQTPEKAHLFSDRDSKAIEEMIKRGEPAPPAKPPQQPAKPDNAKPSPADKLPATKSKGDAQGKERGSALTKTEPQTSSPSTHTAPTIGLSDLFVRPSELARDPALRKGESGGDDKTAEGGKRDLAALSRPELWADPGQRGTPDYLPDVRQGNFTLLNTKADRFAPFVRRVGLRVFQSFSMEFKQQIFAGNVPQGRDNVEVEAVMSRDGRRVEVYLKQRSGNLSSDRVLLGTLNDNIFFDENPPAQAVAEDGRIHFVFAINASVWYGRDEGGRLQPGAHWILGAGLL
jgi:outer membrane biosynthesis protein TonB